MMRPGRSLFHCFAFLLSAYCPFAENFCNGAEVTEGSGTCECTSESPCDFVFGGQWRVTCNKTSESNPCSKATFQDQSVVNCINNGCGSFYQVGPKATMFCINCGLVQDRVCRSPAIWFNASLQENTRGVVPEECYECPHGTEATIPGYYNRSYYGTNYDGGRGPVWSVCGCSPGFYQENPEDFENGCVECTGGGKANTENVAWGNYTERCKEPQPSSSASPSTSSSFTFPTPSESPVSTENPVATSESLAASSSGFTQLGSAELENPASTVDPVPEDEINIALYIGIGGGVLALVVLLWVSHSDQKTARMKVEETSQGMTSTGGDAHELSEHATGTLPVVNNVEFNTDVRRANSFIPTDYENCNPGRGLKDDAVTKPQDKPLDYTCYVSTDYENFDTIRGLKDDAVTKSRYKTMVFRECEENEFVCDVPCRDVDAVHKSVDENSAADTASANGDANGLYANM